MVLIRATASLLQRSRRYSDTWLVAEADAARAEGLCEGVMLFLEAPPQLQLLQRKSEEVVGFVRRGWKYWLVMSLVRARLIEAKVDCWRVGIVRKEQVAATPEES